MFTFSRNSRSPSTEISVHVEPKWVFTIDRNTQPGLLPEQKIKMAMALVGKNRHYKWSELQRRHFDSTAKACGFEAAGKAIIENVLVMTPKVIERVSASLPRGYPESVANAILNGLRSTAQRVGSVE